MPGQGRVAARYEESQAPVTGLERGPRYVSPSDALRNLEAALACEEGRLNQQLRGSPFHAKAEVEHSKQLR
jgi:hypothetical protein